MVVCAGTPQPIRCPCILVPLCPVWHSPDFWADLVGSDSVGLHLGVWRIHSPFRQICRGPFSSVWVAFTVPISPFCASFLRRRVHGEQAVDGDTRYTLTAAAVWKSAPPIASCS